MTSLAPEKVAETKKDDGKCPEVYAGSSFPGFHGTKCLLKKGHEDHPGNEMHQGVSQVGGRLAWFTPAQKLARGALAKARRG